MIKEIVQSPQSCWKLAFGEKINAHIYYAVKAHLQSV